MSKISAGHNDKLDLFKCLAIYGVLLAHIPLPGQFGRFLCAVAKFSVVLFFLTAGYFSYEKSPGTLARRAAKTGRLLLITSAALLIFGCVLAVRQGQTIPAYLQSRMDVFFLKEIIFNQLLPLPYSWPMWYLASQFMVYLLWIVLAWGAKKCNRPLPYNLLAILAVALLAFHMYHVEWQVLNGQTPWESKLVRNAWLDGFPFFALGAWFAHHQERIKSLPVPLMWAGAVVSVGITWMEFCRVDVVDVLLGTTLLAFLLMAISMASPAVNSALLRRTACYCGQNLTFYIYVLHVPLFGIIKEWEMDVALFGWLMGQRWVLMPLIAVVSTVMAVAMYEIPRRIRKER